MKYLKTFENYKINESKDFEIEEIEEIEEIDTGNYVSSSNFKKDHPYYFKNRIRGGYTIEGGHKLSFYKYRNGIIVLADSEGWTVGYKHPRGYGKLYGIWYIKNANETDVEELEDVLRNRINKKEKEYLEKERSLFPEWDELDSSQKKMLRKLMIDSGHLKRKSRATLSDAEEKYNKHISFWGQEIVKDAKMKK